VDSTGSLAFEVIAVFHTDAGHVTLHDGTHDAARHIATGNPTRTSSSA
jgi:hypothetical protein